jgi:predicted ABC-type ATPase
MDYSKPTLFVLSGPNGAGKSTHVQAMLPEALKDLLSFDRDKTRSGFEVELLAKNESPESALKKAGELMEERLLREMIRAIEIKSHFVLETPLSHADYWRYLDLFEDRGTM